MRAILITTGILALPLLALGQTAEPQQTQGQGKTNPTEETTPAKGKKKHAAQEPTRQHAKTEAGTEMRGQTKAHEATKTQAATSTSQTKVNVKEFTTRHREVFTLGRHPKEFFIQRYGTGHFRLIGNTYFVFVDGCWVSVDVDGFIYRQRVICPGDPDFVLVY